MSMAQISTHDLLHGWQSVRLGDVADIAFSGVDKKTIEGEVPVELCNYTDVFYNRRIRPGMGFMAATASPVECQRYALRKGDVLFTKDSETPEEIGIPSYVVEDMPNVLCGYHLGLARPANGTVNGAFLARTLTSEASAREFARIANGVTRFGLTLDATRSLPILLPPLPEQRAIAAVLDSIDEAIEGVEAVITATERLRDALLHELLTRGVPGWHTQWKDVPGIGTIPAAWDVVRLGEIYEVQLGKMLSPKARQGKNPRPYLTNRNVRWGKFDLSDLPTMDFDRREIEKFQLRPGDLLVCEGGDTGRAAVWLGEIADCYYQKTLHRLRPIDENAISEFMLAVLMSYATKGILLEHSERTSISHLTRERLLRMRIPHSSRAEQDEIVAALGCVADSIRWAREEQDRIQTLKSSAAAALLMGRVRVDRLGR